MNVDDANEEGREVPEALLDTPCAGLPNVSVSVLQAKSRMDVSSVGSCHATPVDDDDDELLLLLSPVDDDDDESSARDNDGNDTNNVIHRPMHHRSRWSLVIVLC